ncbi:DUF3541 domain-containing protein [Thalassotalea maritima]|uniref:DUF3541 domain-containing protein n=1 Tax=Thalassotalea maritima TaxID=3242416 RepID=UPI003529BCD5
MSHKFVLVASLLLLFSFMILTKSDNMAYAQADHNRYQETANRIRANYDSNFMMLTDKAQNHYATRMYRFTGEYYYAQQVVDEVLQISARLNTYAVNIQSKSWRLIKAQEMIDELPLTRRGTLRKKALKNTADKRFAMHLIYQMAKLDEYGLQHPSHDLFVAYLKQAELYELMMSSDFIKAYAAQAANYVYWLKQLDIFDWRESFHSAFQFTYPDKRDDKLDRHEFNNKLYGLTHIILADSHYYQRPVSAGKHRWILKYFQQQQQRILAYAKEDILAEIGLCYLLAGLNNHPTLTAVKKHINGAVDNNKNMILSLSGSDNLSHGEHRNVLAYAVLNWPSVIYPGPKLLDYEDLRNQLPLMYR